MPFSLHKSWHSILLPSVCFCTLMENTHYVFVRMGFVCTNHDLNFIFKERYGISKKNYNACKVVKNYIVFYDD